MSFIKSLGRQNVARALAQQPFRMQARGMASEQQLKTRIGSVETCKKITSAMKMVAACKLKAAQDRLDVARVFSKDMSEIFPKVAPSSADENTLVVGITGDKGLCGGVNSQLIRFIRDHVAKGNYGKDVKLVCFGEKVRGGLDRQFGKIIQNAVIENGRLKPATFRQIGLIADKVTEQDFNNSIMVFQYFRSMVAYDTTEHTTLSYDKIEGEHKSAFYQYQIYGLPDTIQNLHEFSIACNLTRAFAESEASTLSSRMTAMDNSSTNAGDMLEALQLLLNRNRQARITTELTEIISGAAAVEEE